MNSDLIDAVDKANETVDKLKEVEKKDKKKIKLLCDDLFEMELNEGDIDNDVKIVPKKKTQKKVEYI